MLKLKYNFLALAVFMVAGLILSKNAHAECKEGEERTTTTGAVFTCDTTSYSALGEAWRDPSGVVWGDVIKKSNGTHLYLNQNDAARMCNWLDAYLPSYEHFDRLREFLGAKRRDTHIPPEGYEAQILPHLSASWFWSSTFNVNIDNAAFFFRGSNGVISYDSSLNLGLVRCVVSR